MKRPNLSKDTSATIAIVIILIAFLAALVTFRMGEGFSFTAPAATLSEPQTLSDTYSVTGTALESNPSPYENSSTTDAVTAAAYSLSDNAELWGWNDGKAWPIASLTKLMTAYVATEVMAPTERVTITSVDEQYLANATATATFHAGDTLSVQDLITSMFVVSSDDAAEALADHYGRTTFLQAMNDEARNLGMTDTTFVSPSGLSTGNLSTTADLYKLVEFLWSTEPGFFATTRETQAAITVYDPQGTATIRYLTNIDKFAGRKDFLGGKTGTLPESAQNLIAIFNVHGTPTAIIILGSEDRYAEAEKILGTL